MLRHSQFSALLALSALLFGNVAGWVHVGCVEVCEHASQEAGERETTEAAGTEVEHCCSGHASESDHAASHDQQPAAPRHSHDSDHCTVCQTFFSQRAISTLFATADVWLPLSPERHCASVEPCVLPAASATSISVRGPPQA